MRHACAWALQNTYIHTGGSESRVRVLRLYDERTSSGRGGPGGFRTTPNKHTCTLFNLFFNTIQIGGEKHTFSCISYQNNHTIQVCFITHLCLHFL